MKQHADLDVVGTLLLEAYRSTLSGEELSRLKISSNASCVVYRKSKKQPKTELARLKVASLQGCVLSAMDHLGKNPIGQARAFQILFSYADSVVEADGAIYSDSQNKYPCQMTATYAKPHWWYLYQPSVDMFNGDRRAAEGNLESCANNATGYLHELPNGMHGIDSVAQQVKIITDIEGWGVRATLRVPRSRY